MRLAARILPLGLLAALAVVASSGCGGATLDPVASAATKTADAGSFRFSFSVAVGAGARSQEAAAGEGAYDADAKRLRATVGVGVGGERLETVVDLSAAPAVYVRPPAEKRWFHVDLAKAAAQNGVDLGTLPQERLDPRKAVEALQRAGDSTKVGEETIDGVETTHYRVALDPKKALETQPAEQRKQAEQWLSLTGVGAMPLDVWVDGDGLLRRIAASFGDAGALFSFGFRLDLSGYGDDVRVELPPADEVVESPLPSLPRAGG